MRDVTAVTPEKGFNHKGLNKVIRSGWRKAGRGPWSGGTETTIARFPRLIARRRHVAALA
jgi:hypothetical protein